MPSNNVVALAVGSIGAFAFAVPFLFRCPRFVDVRSLAQGSPLNRLLCSSAINDRVIGHRDVSNSQSGTSVRGAFVRRTPLLRC